ncbi:hypothetical protein CMMCAS04_01945 [Clavibacter michiganensis subsp. michiganensis]|nr:hypothetical protein CMMCAS04_01945 [Clavibacter michiganensis subsp. michiganensis]
MIQILLEFYQLVLSIHLHCKPCGTCGDNDSAPSFASGPLHFHDRLPVLDACVDGEMRCKRLKGLEYGVRLVVIYAHIEESLPVATAMYCLPRIIICDSKFTLGRSAKRFPVCMNHISRPIIPLKCLEVLHLRARGYAEWLTRLWLADSQPVVVVQEVLTLGGRPLARLHDYSARALHSTCCFAHLNGGHCQSGTYDGTLDEQTSSRTDAGNEHHCCRCYIERQQPIEPTVEIRRAYGVRWPDVVIVHAALDRIGLQETTQRRHVHSCAHLEDRETAGRVSQLQALLMPTGPLAAPVGVVGRHGSYGARRRIQWLPVGVEEQQRASRRTTARRDSVSRYSCVRPLLRGTVDSYVGATWQSDMLLERGSVIGRGHLVVVTGVEVLATHARATARCDSPPYDPPESVTLNGFYGPVGVLDAHGLVLGVVLIGHVG